MTWVNVNFPDNEHYILKKKAKKKGVSLTQMIRILLFAARPGSDERIEQMKEKWMNHKELGDPDLYDPSEDLHLEEVPDWEEYDPYDI